MSKSYPIWHNISACHYKTNKSFGGKNTSEDEIVVGNSAQDSETLARTVTTRRFVDHEKYGMVVIFKYSVDRIILKEAIFENNNGVAGKLLKVRSALGRMKGL